MMICNGINECGDYTDEIFCNGNRPSPPNPQPPSTGSGGGIFFITNGYSFTYFIFFVIIVSVLVVLFILMPLSALLGIIGYIYLPQFLLRIRRGRYSEFRDLSEVS